MTGGNVIHREFMNCQRTKNGFGDTGCDWRTQQGD